MPAHRDLTGAEVHEPKGIEAATKDAVYVSDGAGSGAWESLHKGDLLLNKYWLSGEISDISTPNSHVRFRIPVKSKIASLSVVLDGPITTANATLTIYVNGVAFADTLSVPFAGSAAGSSFNRNAGTTSVLNAGDTIEVRTDGVSDTVAKGFALLGLEAIA